MHKGRCPGCLINNLYNYHAQFVEADAFEKVMDSLTFLQGVSFACIPMGLFCDSCQAELLRTMLEASKMNQEPKSNSNHKERRQNYAR